MNDILNKIIAECPKAWGEWCENKGFKSDYEHTQFLNNDILMECSGAPCMEWFNFRDWYDYFDGLDILVQIEPVWNGFIGCIYKRIGGQLLIDTLRSLHNDRPYAEWNSFLEAFKIREGQL